MARLACARALTARAFFIAFAGVVAACADSSRASAPQDLALVGLPRTHAPQLSVTAYRACESSSNAGQSCQTAGRPTPPPSARHLRVVRAAAESLRAAASASALHTLALADLTWGDSAGNAIDRSIYQFEMASELAPESAALLADMSGAYSVRAAHTHSATDWVRAIEAAERALAADSLNLVARYNVALALGGAGLTSEAARAASAYLALDSSSGWAAELRAVASDTSHTQSGTPVIGVPAVLAGISSTRIRDVVWDSVFAAWAEFAIAHDTVAARHTRDVIAAVANALAANARDSLLLEAVGDVRVAEERGTAVDVVARAHQEYARARTEYRAGRFADVAPRFARLGANASTPVALRHMARVAHGTTLAQLARYDEARRALEGARTALSDARHPSLVARARWSLGTIEGRTGAHEAALANYREAGALYERSREPELSAAMAAYEAEIEGIRGNFAGALATFASAIRTLRGFPPSTRIHNALFTSARLVARFGFPRAALRFHAEDLAAVTRAADPLVEAEAHLGHADGLTLVGDLSAALDALVRARAKAAGVVTFASRTAMLSRVRLSELALASRRGRASGGTTAALDSLVDRFRSERNTLWIVRARLARADALMASGARNAAAADLDAVALLLIAERHDAQLASSRAAIADASARAFDRMVMLQLASGDTVRALEYLEAGRGTLQRKRSAIRENLLVHDYALVGDTLLVWSLEGKNARLVRRTIDAAQLRRRIAASNASLELHQPDSAMRGALAALYDDLVRPVRDMGTRANEIVIVPDDAIGRVPFAALLDTVEKRYLVEDFAVRVVPALGDLRAVRPPHRTELRATLIADPAFNNNAFPGLQRLPGARSEVASVAKSYAAAGVLDGSAATIAAFDGAVSRAGVVHFAGHAVVDAVDPAASFLLFARDSLNPDGARLTADAISLRDLRHVQLVVLSACETALPGSGRARGFGGLASAFLAAGARGVVGTLWRINDATTSPLVSELHRQFGSRTGASAGGASALRAAQLAMLRSPAAAHRHAASWAGFQYVGN